MYPSDEIPLHILPEVDFLASEQKVVFGEHAINHRVNFYAIIWFMEDGDHHYIDFEQYPIRKNMVYLLAEHQVHAIPSANLPNARVVVFSTKVFLSIEELELQQLFLPFDNRGILIPEEMVPYLEKLFSLIVLEYSSAADHRILLKYTTSFLLQLYKFAEHHLQVIFQKDVRMTKLLQTIIRYYREQQPVSFYASEIGLSIQHANKILKATAGTTIGELVYRLLLTEAKRELLRGIFSIKEIAYHLGFSDQSYFSRFFKKQTGISPQQFQREVAGGQ